MSFKTDLAVLAREQATEELYGKLPDYPKFVNALFKPMDTDVTTMLHACVGMSGEAGEILDAAKKCWAYGRELDIEKHVEELGDLRFYYQAELNRLGITDEQVQAYNRRKLLKRYKGMNYSDEAAIARADKEE